MGDTHRPTNQPTIHSENRPRMFFIYNTCMYKYCICIFYCYITRFPDGQRREKQREKKGGEGGLSNLTCCRNQWWKKRRGAQCLDLSIGRSTSRQINPSQIARKTGGRESRGRTRRSSASTHQCVFLSSHGQLVCLLAGLLNVCKLLVLLSSSLPGPSDQSTEV